MTLAINGGDPVRKQPFPDWPAYGTEELSALQRALEQGQWWRVTGKEVKSFEQEFAKFHGCKHALAVTNGTHALEISLLVLGVGPGDEVIVPAFTFISTSMAVQRVGAIPIPVDVDIDTYCINIDKVKQAITPKTKAVIPVHMAGHTIDLEGLQAILEPAGIEIIQDAAHAHGTRSRGRKLGEWGSMACFSFQNFKLMTAGEGGAIIFPNHEMWEKAYLFHNCGRPENDLSYQHLVVGSNCRLNEFSAAILREQLNRLPGQNDLRERNHNLLLEQMDGIRGIIPQYRDTKLVDLHSHYMVMFRLDLSIYPNVDRDFVVKALVAEGIPAFKNYCPIYKTETMWKRPSPPGNVDFYADKCPNTEEIAFQGIWIHHRVLLGEKQDILDVANALKKVLEELGKKELAQ